MADIASRAEWRAEVSSGKMFGVALCSDGTLLRAYSGQILGRGDWPGYVPAVFDYLQPDGYFRRHEAAITSLNHEIASAESSSALRVARAALCAARAAGEREVGVLRATVQAHRAAGRSVAEAQRENADLRRAKQSAAARVGEAQQAVDAIEGRIAHLRAERRERSDALQRWLFENTRLTAPDGSQRSVLQVFTDYVRGRGMRQSLPPAGTGECCAPKLLCYANAHGLRVVQMAEFWYGASPVGEVRHHGRVYEPCVAKCQPILGFLLSSNDVEKHVAAVPDIPVVYEDEWYVAVNKPAGVLSVPGRSGEVCVEDVLRQRYPYIKMTHRLDRDTSGVLLAAKSAAAHAAMQRVFRGGGSSPAGAQCSGVCKEYVARLLGRPAAAEGVVSLPLAADFVNRPRMRVDWEHGKAAVTRYRCEPSGLVHLFPLTGRTHQLRVHCASAEGLACPIVGDPLYGSEAAPRMMLHALRLDFQHPFTGQRVEIKAESSKLKVQS